MVGMKGFILIAGLFILTRFTLLGNLFGRQMRVNRQQLQQQSDDEKAVTLYCDYLLSDPALNNLQILNLKGILRVREASIYLKPYEKTVQNETIRQIQAINPAMAASQKRRIVILGDAGAGKTTLLRWLALTSATNSTEGLPDLPVIVSLSEFVRSRSPRLADFVFDRLQMHLGQRRNYLENRFERGQVLLLFDGLDEIQSDHNADAQMVYKIVSDQIIRLTKKYPRAFIVVTCRRAGWRGVLGDFVPFELVEFGWEDIQDFVRQWATSRQRPELFRPLASALLRSAGVRSLAATPFLLALICVVFEQRGTLPQRRSEIYQWCVEVLLESADRQPGQYLNSLQKQALLRKIALYFHMRGQRDFPREDLLQLINPFMRELNLRPDLTNAILAELVSEQGLLREQGEELYGFAHLSLQEYFVAEAIAENQDYRLIASVLSQPWWQEVIVLLAGLGDADKVMQLVHVSTHDRPALLSLACRCLANQPPVSNPDLAFAVLAEAMQLVLDMIVPVEQKAPVVEALSQIKDPIIISYFSQLFAMRDIQNILRWDLYAVVVLNLVQLGFAESYQVVLQLLARPEIDADLKQKLIDAAVIVGEQLGAIQDLRVMLPALSGDVRAKATLVLLQRGDNSLISIAGVLLRERSVNANLKRRLLGAMAMLLPSPEMVKQFLPLLRYTSQVELDLQLRALELIMRRGGVGAIGLLLDKLVENPERFAPELRRRLLLLAGRFGGAEVLEHLLPILDTTSERTLERPAPISETLKQQTLAAIAALVAPEHDLLLRHWLQQQSLIDHFTQGVAILALTITEAAETRNVAAKFLSGRRANLKEMENQLRQLASETRRSMDAIPTSNEPDFISGWPIGSY